MPNIIYVNAQEHCLVMQRIAASSGRCYSKIDTIQELFPLISDANVCIDLIVVDLSQFAKNQISEVYEILQTLLTLIKCTVYRTEQGRTQRRATWVAVRADMSTDAPLIRDALSTGILGIYPGGDEFTPLEKKLALDELEAGHPHIPEKIQQLTHPRKKTARDLIRDGDIILTPRQDQILKLVSERGASNKVIARLLRISESTVKLHMSAIFKKYGVKNRTQLVLFNQRSKSTIN